MHSRRAFLARAGAVAVAAALWKVPEMLRVRGWYDSAYAQQPDLVQDTFNGLGAFIWPGNDVYSVAQGEATARPGAMAANTTALVIHALDNFVPAPDVPFENDDKVPLSGAVANVLNTVALSVDPLARDGQFLSPFARLSMKEKAEVFRTLQSDEGVPDGQLPPPFTSGTGNFQFLAAAIPVLVALAAFSEWHVFNPQTRTLTGVPMGWAHSGYQGGSRMVPVEGWDEFLGYYQDRRAADA